MTKIVVTEDATCNLEGITLKCLKGLIRFDRVTVPRNLLKKILYMSLKGQHCKSAHLDIATRHSLYEYLKDRDDIDIYIKTFLKESEEIVKWI